VNLLEAQTAQRVFDERHWDIEDDDFHKIRHITLHLTVLLGKLGRYCERIEHGAPTDARIVVDEVTPDLLIYGLQLANIFDSNLEDLYRARLAANRERPRVE
jgi:hypothetical protein